MTIDAATSDQGRNRKAAARACQVAVGYNFTHRKVTVIHHNFHHCFYKLLKVAASLTQLLVKHFHCFHIRASLVCPPTHLHRPHFLVI